MTFPHPETLIPHRAPNLYLSAVVALVEGKSIEARAEIPAELFSGHFPGRPILPGVVMIEMLAQALACLGTLSGEAGLGMLTGVERAKFRGVVELPAVLEVVVSVTDRRFGLTLAKGSVRLPGGKPVCTAELQAVLIPEGAA